MAKGGDLGDLLARAKRTLERHAVTLEKIQRETDDIAVRLEEALYGRRPASLRVRRQARRSPLETGVLEAEALVGARLQMTRRIDGSVLVDINGRRAFRLPPKLADLLAIIASAPPEAGTVLSGWCDADQVAKTLGEYRGTVIAHDDLTKTLHKLREAFKDARENDLLIQRHVDGRVRFARRW